MQAVKRLACTVLLLSLTACDKEQPATEAPTDHSEAATDDSEGLPSGPTAQGTSLTAEASEAGGGTVVGDIGDGAIFEPEYTCESNGQRPIGQIEAAEGGPIGVEGSVCCGA